MHQLLQLQIYLMTALSFDKDPAQLILTQLRKSLNVLPSHEKYFFQVDYVHKNIIKLNPQQAIRYEKSAQEQNLRQYFEQCAKDKGRYLNFKHELKSRYFHIAEPKPKTFEDSLFANEPLQMIKSCSQPYPTSKKDKVFSSYRQQALSRSHIYPKQTNYLKSGYSGEFQTFLDGSERLMHRKSKFRLKNGTIRQKQKQAQKIMNEEKSQILSIVKQKNYSLHRPDSIDKLSNKQKYGLNFIDYMRLKTKANIDRQLYEKKVRKPDSRLQNFQQFIIQQGKFKGKAKEELSDYYIKIREEFKKNMRKPLTDRREE